MRAVIQRVSRASVDVGGRCSGAIEQGLLVYLGVGVEDDDADASSLADKIRHLRVFPDDADRMNLDVAQAGGKVLAVSAFTVQADARRGRRPSFESAAPSEHAVGLYERFCEVLIQSGVEVERGSFGDMMNVESTNTGPVCILLDSRRVF